MRYFHLGREKNNCASHELPAFAYAQPLIKSDKFIAISLHCCVSLLSEVDFLIKATRGTINKKAMV